MGVVCSGSSTRTIPNHITDQQMTGTGPGDPRPPRSRKAAIFKAKAYKHIDRDARKVSRLKSYIEKPFPALVHRITRKCSTDLEKVRALFCWIMSLDLAALFAEQMGDLSKETINDNTAFTSEKTASAEPPQSSSHGNNAASVAGDTDVPAEASDPTLGSEGLEQYEDIKWDSPKEFLKNVFYQMTTHAKLFQVLCNTAKIPCRIIYGITKNAAYKPGDELTDPGLRGEWNAVWIDGEWRLLDVWWASVCQNGSNHTEWRLVNAEERDLSEDTDTPNKAETTENITESRTETQGQCETLANTEPPGQTEVLEEAADGAPQDAIYHIVNEFFFLTDPDMLIATHFPENESWQLLPVPISIDTFEKYVYVRERFFQLGLRMSEESEKYCVIKSKNGEVRFAFSLDPAHSDDAIFKYLFYSLRTEYKPEHPLNQYVMYERTSERLGYHLRFPSPGTFRMDVFGKRYKHTTFDLLCSYVIECEEPKSNCQRLPITPVLGWGPTFAVDYGQIAIDFTNHKRSVISSMNGVVDIHLSTETTMKVTASLTRTDIEEWKLKRYLICWQDEDEVHIEAQLREAGEYALSVYVESRRLMLLKEAVNVCNYLIDCVSVDDRVVPYPAIRTTQLGASALAGSYGVALVTDIPPVIRTTRSTLQLKMSRKQGVDLYLEVNSEGLGLDPGDIIQRCQPRRTDSETNTGTFDLELHQEGEYALNFFAKDKSKKCSINLVYVSLVKYKKSLVDAEDRSEPIIEKNLPERDTTTNTIASTSDSPILLTMIPDATSDSNPVRMNSYGNQTCDPVLATGQEDFDSEGKFNSAGVTHPPEARHLTVTTARSYVDIRVRARAPRETYCAVTWAGSTSNRPFDKVSLREEGAENVFRVGLPVFGTYHVLMLEEMKPGYLKVFSSYEVRRRPKIRVLNEIGEIKEIIHEKPVHVRLLRQLRAAIQRKDRVNIEKTLEQLRDLNMESLVAELQRAADVLELIKLEEKLRTAMSSNIQELESAMAAVQASPYSEKLRDKLSEATTLLAELELAERKKSIMRAQRLIMELDSKTISEIKRYNNPVAEVKQVMAAVCILIGEEPLSMREWRSIQVVISKLGSDSLQSRIRTFRLEYLLVETAVIAQSVLTGLSKDTVFDISAGIAVFFDWAQTVINTVLSKFVEDGGDLRTIEKDVAEMTMKLTLLCNTRAASLAPAPDGGAGSTGPPSSGRPASPTNSWGSKVSLSEKLDDVMEETAEIQMP